MRPTPARGASVIEELRKMRPGDPAPLQPPPATPTWKGRCAWGQPCAADAWRRTNDRNDTPGGGADVWRRIGRGRRGAGPSPDPNPDWERGVARLSANR